MTEEDLSIDIDVAAKARASVIEEGEAGFDMEVWYKANCSTNACLAGHIVLAAGVSLRERRVENQVASHEALGYSGWSRAATCLLFGLDNPEFYEVYDGIGSPGSKLQDIFLEKNKGRAEIVDEFDKFVARYTTEEEYDTYLHKSYAYQGHYRRQHELAAKNNGQRS